MAKNKSSILETLDLERLPQHIAIIMDGNGRWAQSQDKPRVFGHKNGVNAVRETTEAAAELGLKHLTLYAFSTENWSRPEDEVNTLMSLLVDTIQAEMETLMKNKVRLSAIGQLDHLPPNTQRALIEGMKLTKDNDGLELILALNYSGKTDIVEAVKKIVSDIDMDKISQDDISEALVNKYLYTSDRPDPELMIRTSGERRISNFLLWQMAYTEFYFTDILWPDFNKEEFYRAIRDFQHRERRFGKTSQQILAK